MNYDLDRSDYEEQVCIYLLYPSFHNSSLVYYLEKNKLKEPTYKKLIGWSGNIDKGENLFKCVKRELAEELPMLKFEKNHTFVHQGTLIRDDLKKKIYIVKTYINQINNLPDNNYYSEVENGFLRIKPIKYHKHWINKFKFLKSDLMFLDKLYFSDETFKIEIGKNE